MHLTRKEQLIELIPKTNENEYMCPNETYDRWLKVQGVAAHVKACAKLGLKKQDVAF